MSAHQKAPAVVPVEDDPSVVPLKTLVRVFLRIRDKRSVLKRTFEEQDEELKGQQRAIENELLRRAHEEGTTGFQTPAGTTYISEEKHVSIADPEEFRSFLENEDDPFAYFEQRPALGRIVEYQKAHDGELPPGVRLFREMRMRVRATKKKEGDAN